MLSTVRAELQVDASARARKRRLSIAAAAVAVAVVLAVAGTLALDHGSSSGRPARSPPIAAARATRATLRMMGAHAELAVSDMPEPPIGEIYELWLNRPGRRPQPTDALFTVTSAGNGAVEVPGSLRGVREVMVTSEPLGGSSSPTSAAVLRLRVPHAH